MSSAVVAAVEMSVLPMAMMLVGMFTVLVSPKAIPERVEQMTQHFAAGIVTSAIATEMVPLLTTAAGAEGRNTDVLGLVIGFAAGVALMLGIKEATGGHGHGDDGGGADEHGGHGGHGDAGHGGHGGHGGEAAALLDKCSHGVAKKSCIHHAKQVAQLAAREVRVPFPTARVSAVAIDALVDGLLVGIACSVGGNAGIVMAVALGVEMFFLGITTSTSIKSASTGMLTKVAVCLAIPLCILVGAALGSSAGSTFKDNAPLFKGVVGFGTAALLYLVTEELLAEAHEGGDEAEWWVHCMFFVGFIATLVTDLLSE